MIFIYHEVTMLFRPARIGQFQGCFLKAAGIDLLSYQEASPEGT